MNYLGIDYGEKRIGLSTGDDDVRLAVPIPAAVEPTREARVAHIAKEIQQRRIGSLVVGYPYNMDGSVGFKAKEVDAFIAELEAKFGLPIHRTDERLTSQAAEAQMRSNKPKKSRSKVSVKAKQEERRSGNLDSRAAALILQDYLDGGITPLFIDDDDE
ncbi:Holliday junction resolvase RuvX [Cerasicoccus arenae]|uniref:Putative pre-16S rRNA nuclease n=1 Tax=Cerasicoccus arenae TaxID=424488 RepID=A0A8J3GD77_9BACT|nr:Holliday junction resolvase RuvX [Cerasicoccus arenae]MBK1859486.1 Holliday junction resolvase RuvX [Cerasicoccus arenae]GHB94913.1 putative pre-16S rRNA nuclease [Cerasicoccus arenae]